DCTTVSMCQNLPTSGPVCLPVQYAAAGTPCGGGCGTCQPVVPVPGGPTTCQGDAANAGNSCDPGIDNPCVVGQCQFFTAGNIHTAICFPHERDCEDTDGDPCTDVCNPATGQCERDAPKCVPFCETCERKTGQCMPTNIGQSCTEGADVCSPVNHCQAFQLSDGTQRGLCRPGPATVPTATATVMTCPAGAAA